MNALEWAFTVGKLLLVFVPLTMIPIMIFMERKGASLIQDRVGPNRVSVPFFGGLRLFGFVHNVTDGIKLFTKELIVPKFAHKWYYIVAPMIPFAIAVMTPALLPWCAPIVFEWGGSIYRIPGQILDADGGILVVFALSGLSVYGTVLGAWSSNSKYALLGGLRASAMMISYEVSMGLSLLGMFLLAGSFRLSDIVAWQGSHYWGVLIQPIPFVIYVISLIAETGRAPFDVAEGEPEILGHHLEYSGMRFGLFYMGEYAHIVINSLLIATMFLGGYDVPVLHTEGVKAHLGLVIAAILGVFGLSALGLMVLLRRWAAIYAKTNSTDKVAHAREYAVTGVIFGAIGAALLAAAVLSALLIQTSTTLVGGEAIYPLWTSLLTAFVQFGVLFAKALLFCWVWVWVRWSLPRFRYDQVMSLGWKILLNVALVNLVVTALVAKLLQGGR